MEQEKQCKKKQQYVQRMTYFHTHKRAAFIIHILNRSFTCIVFAIYTFLLVYLLLQKDAVLARAIIVPMNGFVFVSVFRYFVNRKRPYEAYGATPAIKKLTKGKSFPSRHVFSVFMIAITCLFTAPSIWCGVFLLVLGGGIAAVRVISGVHYVSDAIAGIAFAVAFGFVGFVIL